MVVCSVLLLLSCATGPKWPPERWPLTCTDAEQREYTADRSPPIHIDGLKTSDPMVQALQQRRAMLHRCISFLRNETFSNGAVVVQFHTSGDRKVDDICILENNLPSRRSVQCTALVIQETQLPPGVTGTFIFRAVFELQ